MTTITLNSIEPQIAQRLQQQADQNGRTIEAEIATILTEVLSLEQDEKDEAEDEVDLFTAIRRRVDPVGGIDLPEIPREAGRTPPVF